MTIPLPQSDPPSPVRAPRPLARLLGVLAAALAALVCAAPPAAAGLAAYVAPFAGTRPGPGTFGGGHNFPGATVPFGMVQWSPDTTPADQRGEGGYDYRDHHIKGFSLTHLSGAGCEVYGDFPFLPTTKHLESSPAAEGSELDADLQPGFSHAHERAHPGYYGVRLNPVEGGDIQVQLTAATRSGAARFTFPRGDESSVLINAGGSAQPDDLAEVSIDPSRSEIDGVASSGLFCGQRPRYRVYVAAVFNRPFAAYGTWSANQLHQGSTQASETRQPAQDPPSTADAGAYATFDTQRNRSVVVRVGLSFVSVAQARANLEAEAAGVGFDALAARALASWNRSLRRIEVSGGPRWLLRTFYTALYHAFIAPRTFSDADGTYIGMDGAVHRAVHRVQYTDFSGWDVYRTQIPLLAILAPQRASDLVRSLLADAAESGCLPRWSIANGQTMTMVGDPADPAIASAAAFGADEFDHNRALAAMLRGATHPCRSANGEYVERQGLGSYLSLGYLPWNLDANRRNANSLFGSPESVWGSAATTLEYDVADFSIAQLAARLLGDRSTYRAFMQRSGTWRRLFNRSSGMIEPREASGSFLPDYDDVGGGGFVEGNSYQYTWMVPQDPGGLFARMGGKQRAAARLGRFLRALNGSAGGTHTTHALLGNEPDLNAPWLFDWMGRPWGTQLAVRRALLSLYDTSPDGYPGNDDLGTLSSWYVFGALGLYPEVPGVGVLALGSPLFERATLRLPHRRRAVIRGRGRGPYVQALRIDGRPYAKPWLTYCALAGGADLSFDLGRRPNRRWGAASGVLPPSFGPQRRMPHGVCAP